MTEGMPSSMSGFKNHPLYVLERHLRREQVVHPAITIGTFRGEPVYPRGNVVELKTAENWMRSEGREVKNGEQPMKMVKIRASTVRRKREVEVAMMEMADRGGGSSDENGVMQGLYAEWQTKFYEPPPVIDGKVPKNDFGNIDLYTPSMLPQGGIHLPYKGIAKIARKLGIDHAEAVTGFEFKQRRALPIITGIVVAEEESEVLLEAYWASEHAAEEKERQKKQERVFKRWQKLVKGLRIRQRLLKEYSVNGAVNETVPEVPDAHDVPEDSGGGFLVGGERNVVQRFSLPKMQHVIVSHAPIGRADPDSAPMEELIIEEGDSGPAISPSAFGESAENEEDDEAAASAQYNPKLPMRSMAELAAEAEAAESSTNESRGESATGATSTYPLRTRRAGIDSTASPATRAMARAKLGSSPASSVGQTSRKRSRTVKSSLQAPASRTRRGRKSSRTTSEEEEEEESSLSNETDEAEEDDDRSAGAKRPRRGGASTVPKVEATPSAGGRVLRARKGKTDEQLRAEKEQERAYRKAIAE
ncbi:hypothetical protein FRC00_002338 [Tulasnella sp. 408]|nr:hypothetical protein FRC00_002338 [Tulasnella sp. 408]